MSNIDLHQEIINSLEIPKLDANSSKEEIKALAEKKTEEIKTFTEYEVVLQSLVELFLIVKIVETRNEIIAELLKDYPEKKENLETRIRLINNICYKTSNFFHNSIFNIVKLKFGQKKAK